MKLKFFLLGMSIISQPLIAIAPLGLFVPYDINIKQIKPATHSLQFLALGEHSYKVHGYATDYKEEDTFKVNALQIYEPYQNIIALYQGNNGEILSTPFTQLLDSIAGGAGGGVANYQNGIFKPTGHLSCGQVSFGAIYGLADYFYLSAYIPVCFAKLSNLNLCYAGTNTFFADEVIQQKIVNSFITDAAQNFGLNVSSWKKHGLGDLTLLLEWQRDFAQRRQVLKCVHTNIRLGLEFPTSCPADPHIIMPVPFGADGSFSIPFAGNLGLNLSNVAEIGFSGQFWYFWSNEKLRRIQTFPTQTSLLLPQITSAYKTYSVLQNFNLYAQVFSFCKRFALKAFYQYWRKQKDTIIPINTNSNYELINSTQSLDEMTRHQFCLLAKYSPRFDDFKKVVPQFEMFWKASFKGTRAAIASTYGAQFSILF